MKTLIYCAMLLTLGWIGWTTGISSGRSDILQPPDTILPFVEPGLELSANASKDKYILGEVVKLEISVSNPGDSDVFLCGIETTSGCLKIYISTDGDDFKLLNSGGTLKKQGGPIRAGQTLRTVAPILFNLKPKTSHLNADAAEKAKKNRVLTDYVFDKPGTYLVKAVLIVPATGNPIRIESKPVRVEIKAPSGNDLLVWQSIRNSAEFAYFMNTSQFLSSKGEEQKLIRSQLEQVLHNNPTGILADQLRLSLDLNRASAEKLKIFLEQHRQP